MKAFSLWRIVPLFLLLFGLALPVASCADDNLGGIKGFGKKKHNANGGDDDDSVGGGDGASKTTKTIEANGAHFQVKDITLLKSTISSCMGDGMTLIHGDMILAPIGQPSTPQTDPSKMSFLLPTKANAEGADIIDAESGNLLDLSRGTRTSITGDSLTDTYLRSLETVANVVAHNCSADNPNCKCDTEAASKAMLTRCMPGLDPATKEMAEATTAITNVCKKDATNMRKSIASMLASYAFAAAH